MDMSLRRVCLYVCDLALYKHTVLVQCSLFKLFLHHTAKNCNKYRHIKHGAGEHTLKPGAALGDTSKSRQDSEKELEKKSRTQRKVCR